VTLFLLFFYFHFLFSISLLCLFSLSFLSFLSLSGYMLTKAGVSFKSIIESIDQQPTPSIQDAIRIFTSLQEGQEFVIKFFRLSDPLKKHALVCRMDKRWHQMTMYTRNDLTGIWDRKYVPSVTNIPFPPPPPVVARYENPDLGISDQHLLRAIRSLVLVEYDVPFCVDALSTSGYLGILS